MSGYMVIANADLESARAVVHSDSFPQYEPRGWTIVGPTSQQFRLTTDDEQAALDAAADELVAAASSPEPDPAPVEVPETPPAAADGPEDPAPADDAAELKE